MVLDYLLISNYQEIEKAQSLALPTPELKHSIRRLIVDINDISVAFVNFENNIEIEVRGFFYEIKFEINENNDSKFTICKYR